MAVVVRNVSPYGALSVPALGVDSDGASLVVGAGETVEVSDALGASLLEQAGTWESAGGDD